MIRSVALLGISILAAQEGLRVEVVGPTEPLPKSPPSAEARPESKSPIDPDDAYRELVSGDPERIVRTYKALGLDWIGEWLPVEVRAQAVNLDSDEMLERVLIIDNRWNTAVVVLKRKQNEWWSVGVMLCGAPRGRCSIPFVELKQTVWYGTYDLVFHSGGSAGLGLSEHRLMVYRMFAGRLYPVFDAIEEAADMSGEESSKFRFRKPDFSEPPASIVAHRTKEFRGRRTTACIPQVWNVEKFAFLPVPPTRALCTPRD